MTNNDMMKQLRKALEMFVTTLPDDKAVEIPSVSKHWKVGESVQVDDRRYFPPTEKLYKCLQAHTTQADWTPDLTPSLWAVIDVTHAGTIDDPIPAALNMEYTEGLYYLDPEDGKLYRCTRSSGIALAYLPHQLVGQYFEEVTV